MLLAGDAERSLRHPQVVDLQHVGAVVGMGGCYPVGGPERWGDEVHVVDLACECGENERCVSVVEQVVVLGRERGDVIAAFLPCLQAYGSAPVCSGGVLLLGAEPGAYPVGVPCGQAFDPEEVSAAVVVVGVQRAG